MSAKRIILVIAALGLVWFAFFRKKALPNAAPAASPNNVAGAANAAVAQTIRTAVNAAQPYIANITGQIINGVAHTFPNTSPGSQGGTNSSATTWSPPNFVGIGPADYVSAPAVDVTI
jgi:hypothetical protein